MATLNQAKELAESDTPLLLFECILPSGDAQYWSTHSIAFNNQQYAARVLKHNLFDLQLSADDAMDGITQLSLTLANADSALSEMNSVIGFKGAQLTAYFAFADLPSGTVITESTVLFRGVAGDPDVIAEDSMRLSFTNKLSLQRIPVPEVRIQRSCPWTFPTTPAQLTEAKNGGSTTRFSRYYRCGYSAGVPGGVGNLDASGQPFTSCDYSRTQCQQRGMFDRDNAGNITRRYGGFEFVPSATMVRTSGQKSSHVSPLQLNAAKYNDPVPIVYGTGWIQAPINFARNDGNLTHMEVIIGMGTIQSVTQAPVQSVFKVVVNDVEIPLAVQGQDMTTTGWYNVVTTGTRNGNFNLDFTDSNGTPLGDPYGSIAVLSVVVPNRISSGRSLPTVEVLLQGMQIDTYNVDGSFLATTFTNNPAWVILDILRRCGWSLSDLNLPTFARSAAFCGQLISTTDLNGNAIQVPRYECNLVLTKRQSAAVVVRGIRVASSLMLRYGSTGLLELLPETTLAAQQPTLPDGGNSTAPLNGGWPAYEFSDASGPFSGIVRNLNGTSTLRLLSRSISETSNRLSVEFQDESNEYQQDSLSVVDADDAALIGYEISSQSTALGISNFSQANRVLLRQLDKSTKGNQYVEFETSFRALKVRPGDIIALTYAKEGLSRVPFRVTKLSPSMNYQVVTILAQIHDDDWYSDNPAILGGAGRQPGAGVQVPRPLIGTIAHLGESQRFEYFDFGLQENIQALPDGTASDILTLSFAQPTKPNPNSPNLPLVSLSPQYTTPGGSLPGGSTFYYALTATDAAGNEGALSFTIPATTPGETDTNSVTLRNLSFPSTAVACNVYRGTTPQLLYAIASTVPLNTLVPDPTGGLQYTDAGSPPNAVGPPDASFDHANFYYRAEYAGPFQATVFTANTIGNASMGATNLAYAGMVVRIIEGTGRNQERSITTNDQTTLTVNPGWATTPDQTSVFVIAEPSWKFAAISATSPAQFEVPYAAGTVIEISGRGANVNNQEGFPDLCPLTRCALGATQSDAGLPGAPNFQLEALGDGSLTLYDVGFNDLKNTESVSTGTLKIFYWNELDNPSGYSLAADLGQASTSLSVQSASGTPPFSPVAGSVIQVDTELITVVSIDPTSGICNVARGMMTSSATAHTAGTPVLPLASSVVIVPFAPDFFQNKASGNFVHTVTLPDIRISAAEFSVANVFGGGQAQPACYTSTGDGGLRTLSGGQFSIQVSGFLATQQNAAPPLLVESSHAVKDIRAMVGEAAMGYSIQIDVLQNGAEYCSMAIAPGATASGPLPANGVYPSPAPISGVSLPPLQEGATLSMNISLQVMQGYQGSVSPGRDLTMTIRL